MQNVYSVKQVNSYIKNMFTQDFMLNRIYIKGEVSNCKYHTSGHVYFSLKDESGTISAILFAGQRKGISFQMKDGQQVVVLGSVTTYERDGKYQLYAKEIILDGAGRLYEKYEQLKQELEEMGMFSKEYKQVIPAYAKRIGIVTAPTGAAIRDIMNIASRRNPYVQLLLYPALVQGDGAVPSIIKGLRVMEEKQVDVIIVGRGGGSIEDLWAFNEAEVARAIFECRVPVISAVGHETDTTIADFVADLRAPTPSAAAELAVAEHSAVAMRLQEIHAAFKRIWLQKVQNARGEVIKRQLKLSYLNPKNRLLEQQQLLADLQEKMNVLMRRRLDKEQHRLALSLEIMKGLSPLEKLNKGYAYVQNSSGKTLRSVEKLTTGDSLEIFVTDGTIQADVTNIIKGADYGRK